MNTFVDLMNKHKISCANTIIENILLGDFYAALDKRWQRAQGIVAVLTVAEGLNIEPAAGLAHKVCYARDTPDYDLSKHFDECYEFISFWTKKGQVLVHCAAGVSRSATIVIYYLMRSHKWSFAKSFQFVKQKRNIIHPNDGFIRLLKAQEKKLGLVVFQESTKAQEQAKADIAKPTKGVIRGRSVVIRTQKKPIKYF